MLGPPELCTFWAGLGLSDKKAEARPEHVIYAFYYVFAKIKKNA